MNKKGFTLIEVMIVLVIIGVIAFLGINAIRGTFKSKARELSWRMASTMKYLFNSAITENKTVRLVFDLENNQYWAESTTDKFLMEKRSKEDLEKFKKDEEKKLKQDAEGAGPGKEESSAPKTSGDKKSGEEENGEETPSVEPIEATFGAMEDVVFEAKPIPAGVFLKDVWTSHDEGPVDTGRAYIYFFSSGYSEHAIINFKDENDEKQLSIRLNPFNGGVDVEQEYRKME